VAINAIGPTGAQAILRPSAPEGFLAHRTSGAWLIDPLLVDCALQVQLVWARLHWDVTSLPNGIQSCRWYGLNGQPGLEDGERRGRLDEQAVRCEFRIRRESQAPISRADHYFFGSDDRLLGYLEDVEMTGSVAANRLVGARGSGGT
jgi:hypothetical protein